MPTITNNTLLKIVFRNGTDAERKNTVLTLGEPAYTTDTKRFFIGDGTTGGVLMGNKFLGLGPDITVFAPAEIGDVAYDNDKNILYTLTSGEGSNITDWTKIGGQGITSNTSQSLGGNKIDNLVRVTSVQWSTLSGSNDPNTHYIVSDTNYTVI